MGDGLDLINGAREATRAKGGSEKESGLGKIALAALATGEKVVSLGLGKVNRHGFSFFIDGEPQTAWITAGSTAREVMAALHDKKIFEMSAAYDVYVQPHGSTPNDPAYQVKIVDYHTMRRFKEAPPVSVGETVEVFTEINEKTGKPCYMFKKLKK